MNKLWQKKYQLDKVIEQYTVGDDHVLDMYLAPYDCIASKAHASMLKKMGLISSEEAKSLHEELDKIIDSIEKGDFIILPEQEDCHTVIESILTNRLGDLGKKIHTARSRNDQVLTAMRLYVKNEMKLCEKLIEEFVSSIRKFEKK